MKIGVLLDLDGTLLNTLEDLADGVNVAMAQMGYPLRELEEVRRFVGNGVGHLLRCAAPEGAELSPVMDAFMAWYSIHCQDKTRPYDGILEALEELKKDYPIAVVSNKPDSAVKQLCQALFAGVYGLGQTDAIPRKPAPDMVWAAMKHLGVEKCIYVGDSEVDLKTAENAGVPCISVLWGFRTRQELEQAGATLMCEHPSQLKTTVDRARDALFCTNP